MEREPLGFSLKLRTPPLPATPVEVGTGPRALAWNYPIDMVDPPIRSSLTTCDLVSHAPPGPDTAQRSGGSSGWVVISSRRARGSQTGGPGRKPGQRGLPPEPPARQGMNPRREEITAPGPFLSAKAVTIHLVRTVAGGGRLRCTAPGQPATVRGSCVWHAELLAQRTSVSARLAGTGLGGNLWRYRSLQF
jgi:hypothetical protein